MRGLVHPPSFLLLRQSQRTAYSFSWADSGINTTSACAWLCIHNHSWEFGDLFQREIFLEVQKLAFKSYGEKAGRTQIDYLSEDLAIEGTIKLSKFYNLVEAHSEAQPYFG